MPTLSLLTRSSRRDPATRLGRVRAAALLLALAASSPTFALAEGGFSLWWFTIDGGGATPSTGGAYSLNGTIGQPDADVLSRAPYTLQGGFWNADAAVTAVENPAPELGVESDGVGLPSEPRLHPNIPNPFNPMTAILYELPRSAWVEVSVYNVGGQRVRVLVDAVRPAGRHVVRWDGTNETGRSIGSGAYFIRLTAEGRAQIQKAILLR